MSNAQPDHQVAYLVALNSIVSPDTILLREEIYTLGRAATCEVVINNKIVSRLHAKIELNGQHFVLRDAGSANGTFINERRLQEPHILRNNDCIGLGSNGAMLRFIDLDSTVANDESLQFDEQNLSFSVNQQKLELTPAQFRLLRHFYQHTGDICTRERCADVLWNREFDPAIDGGALDQVVSGIRAKLRHADPTKEYIQTRRGFGYILML